MEAKIKHFYEFAGFRLDAASPSLWRGKELIPIAPKALETLILLVTRKGEIVSRNELIETVWKDTFVEEGNINYTIFLLRKIFDDKELIKTIPRHGYRFTADVEERSVNGEPSVVISEASAREPGRKSRPAFLAIGIITILLIVFIGFAWRGVTSGAETRTGAPAAALESTQAYKRGMAILDDKDVENREQKALAEFQQAVTLDPTSALAYSGLAEGMASKAYSMPNQQSLDFFSKGKAAAEKALALDENLPEAFLVRGWIRRNGDWDWSGAEQDIRRAIEINPNVALAHFRYSQLLANIGRHSEALAEIRKADQINPLSEVILTGHFPLLESARKYDEALKLAEEYLQNNPESPFALRAYGTFMYHKGNYPKVIESGERALSKSGKRRPFAWLSLLSAAYSKSGQPEKSLEMLKELEIQSHTDKKALYSLAMNYAELGHIDEAIIAIENCLEAREQRMMWVGVEPRFAALKNEPRFRNVLGKMRLN